MFPGSLSQQIPLEMWTLSPPPAQSLEVRESHPQPSVFTPPVPHPGISLHQHFVSSLLTATSTVEPCVPDHILRPQFPQHYFPELDWIEVGGSEVTKEKCLDFSTAKSNRISTDVCGRTPTKWGVRSPGLPCICCQTAGEN